METFIRLNTTAGRRSRVEADEVCCRAARRRRSGVWHRSMLICAAMIVVQCTGGAGAEETTLKSDDGAGVGEAGTAGGDAAPPLRTDQPQDRGKAAKVPGLRDEDGDPAVGGRMRDTECPLPDDDAKPKLRGSDEKAVDAESKVEQEKMAQAAREKSKAAAAAKAKEAQEKAAALARLQNGSLILVDSTEFIEGHAAVLQKQILEALGGGAQHLAALKDGVLEFFGGQWENSLWLCRIHEFSNGTIVKVPCVVQNRTLLFKQVYENATAHGDPQSQYWLGRMFQSGANLEGKTIFEKDVDQAAQLYMAAGPAVPAANRQLGQLLAAHGDIETAAQLFAKALEMGDVRSIALLGRLYEQHGELEQAVDLYTQGANQQESLAMTCAALLLLQGRGVEQDAGKARELLVYAASQLESSAFYVLASALESGEGLPASAAAAATFYDIAAMLGHPGAAGELARLLGTGAGVAADSEKALSWAQTAKERGVEWKSDGSRAVEAKAEYEALLGKHVLKGGRPSRYQYVPITTYPLSVEEKAAQDALGFTGADPTPTVGETARYRYMAGKEYFKLPTVFWEGGAGDGASGKAAKAA